MLFFLHYFVCHHSIRARRAKTGRWCVVAMLLLLFMFPTKTQAQNKEKGQWHFLAEPYVMFPYMDGSTGVGNLPKADVDANPGDIFSKLKIGAMLYVEASNNQWSVSSDFIYMDLRQNVTGDVLIESGEFSAEQLAWELAGLKRLAGWLEVGIGGRLNNMKAGLDLVKTVGNPREEERSLSKTWVDPILIVRTKGIVKEKWLLQFRGDFGGFGIGSDFTWQVQAYAGYGFSKLFQLTAGYRVIGVDYDKGTGLNRFVYDIITFGPVVRLGLNF